MSQIEYDLSGVDTLCVMQPSLWRPTTSVKTYFVASKPRKGYFTSLSDAIAFADPYSKISIESGRYFENVVLTKPMEVVSSKGISSVEFYSQGTTLTIDVDEAYIYGISVSTNEPESCAVTVESGSPTLLSCALESLSVVNKATPTVEESVIAGSHVHGISIMHQAGGMFRQNTIENHSRFCIYVESTGQPEFAYNKVTKGDLGQICIVGNGGEGPVEPNFRYNRIVDQMKKDKDKIKPAKVKPVKETGDSVLLLTHQSRRYGKRLYHVPMEVDECEERNHLHSTANFQARGAHNRFAIVVSKKANPTFYRNAVTNCLNTAFRVMEGSRGVAEYNSVYNNHGSAFLVEGNSSCILSRNTVHSNGAGGFVIDMARCTIAHNDVHDNVGMALTFRNRCDVLQKVHHNTVYGTHTVGVHCTEGSRGTFYENNIRECTEYGVLIDHGSSPCMEANVVHLCHIGVSISNQSRGELSKNKFFKNTVRNVEIKSASNPIFRANHVISSLEGLVILEARGTFQDNKFYENRKFQICVSGPKCSKPIFVHNMVKAGCEIGAIVTHGAQPTFRKNVFTRNCGVHVRVENRSDPLFEFNVIHHGLSHGIVITTHSNGTFVENEITQNTGDGIQIMFDASPSVRGNIFDKNGGIGLLIRDNGTGVIEKNIFHANIVGNLSVVCRVTKDMQSSSQQPSAATASTQAPCIMRNIFAFSEYGVSGSDNAFFKLERNRFEENRVGVVLSNNAHPSVYLNEFDGGETGVLVHELGNGYIVANHFQSLLEGIAIKSSANPYVYWNSIEQCKNGILSHAGSGFVFSNAVTKCDGYGMLLGNQTTTRSYGNIFFRNAVGVTVSENCSVSVIASNCMIENERGIHVQGKSSCKVECNLIFNQQVGIQVSKCGTALFSHNVIMGSTQSHIVVETNADPTFDAGVLVGKGINGIEVREAGKGHFTDLSVCGREVGVLVTADAAPTFTTCHFIDNNVGVRVGPRGAGSFVLCSLARNKINLSLVEAGGFEFTKCMLSQGEKGLIAEASSPGTLAQCIFTENKVCGAHLIKRAVTNFKNCMFRQHPNMTVVVDDALGMFDSCSFTQNSGHSFLTNYCGDPTVTNCCFKENNDIAIVVTSEGLGMYSMNTITQNKNGQVQISGVNANPTFKDNTVTCSSDFGFLVDDGAFGTIYRNIITECAREGILVKKEGEPTFTENEVTACVRAGALVTLGGKGTFKNNKIHHNAAMGFSIVGVDTLPTLVGNVISHNGSVGVIVDIDAECIATSNTVFENGKANVSVQGNANPIFNENTFYGSCVGVEVQGARGLYHGNIFQSHKKSAVHVVRKSVPKFCKNMITKEDIGMLLENACGEYNENIVQHCTSYGVLVRSGDPIFGSNKFAKCHVGVKAERCAMGKFHMSWFADNKVAHFVVDSASETVLHRNYFNAGVDLTVIQVLGGSAPKIDENYILGGQVTIDVSDDSCPLIKGNTIASAQTYGIRLTNSKGDIRDNIIYACATANIVTLGTSCTRLEGNILLEGSYGVLVGEKSKPDIRTTDICGSTTSGLCIKQDATPALDRCTFHDIRSVAISDSGQGTVSECTIWGCSIGIETQKTSRTTYKACEVRDCHSGVLCGAGSQPTLTKCTIAASRTVGVTLQTDSNITLQGSSIWKSRTGVLCQEGSCGVIKDNQVYWNGDNIVIDGSPDVSDNTVYDAHPGAGILIRAGSPIIYRNVVFDNTACGVTVESGGRAEIIDNKLYHLRDYALVLAPDTGSRVISNLLKNVDTYPWPSGTIKDRQLRYNKWPRNDKAGPAYIQSQRRLRDKALRFVQNATILVDEITEPLTEDASKSGVLEPIEIPPPQMAPYGVFEPKPLTAELISSLFVFPEKELMQPSELLVEPPSETTKNPKPPNAPNARWGTVAKLTKVASRLANSRSESKLPAVGGPSLSRRPSMQSNDPTNDDKPLTPKSTSTAKKKKRSKKRPKAAKKKA